jgi:hypothetical protein
MNTEASVFIIESLSFVDEKRYLEGRVLKQILSLSDKKAKYVYIRTAKELAEVLDQFYDSGFRYLHLSCHGNAKEIALTLDTLTFVELARFMEPILDGRRLFVSACSVVNEDLARAVIPTSGCQSIVGPATDVTFGDAALMWASFYHLVFKTNPDAMDMKTILSALERTRKAFDVSFKYFTSSTKHGFTERRVGPASGTIAV